MKTFGLLLLVLCAGVAQATVWDVWDQTYGSGAGQMPFNNAWVYYWGGAVMAETDVDGKAILALPGNDAMHYPSLSAIAGMPHGTPVTFELKMALPGNTMAYLFDCDQIGSPHWNNIVMFNGLFNSGATPNTLQDYNRRGDLNIAPVDFDGSAVHTYTFVYDGSAMSMYLDNNPTAIAQLINDAGASGDGLQFELGFKGGSADSTVEIYSFKVANGAYAPVPEPATMGILGCGILIAFRRKMSR